LNNIKDRRRTLNMKNKKDRVLIILSAFLIFSAGLVAADSNDDYRVIKNAIKKTQAKSSSVLYFRILVKDSRTGKKKVRIKLPLNLIEFFIDKLDDDISIRRYGKKIDFKTVLQLLKKNGPQTLVEVTEEDHIVKLWIE
jgi:hypothetical protein